MNLVKLRKRKGLTQEDVAKHLNMTQSSYQHYETGRSEPNIETLKKLADLYVVSVDYLIDRQNTRDFSYVDNEYYNFFRTVLKLTEENYFVLKGYVFRLLQEQNN